MSTRFTCPHTVIIGDINEKEQTMLNDRIDEFPLTFCKTDANIGKMKRVHVYVTYHPTETCFFFKEMCGLSQSARHRWLHVNKLDDITKIIIESCFLAGVFGYPTNIKTDNIPLDPNYFIDITPDGRKVLLDPLVSLFTTSYRSGGKILRPYFSLLRQTYTNWEWIILDDSNDDGKTFNETLMKLPEDPRIRRYFPDKASGFIGEVKNYAAGLCKGKILFEMDHDDELEIDCLEKIVNTFRSDPSIGFVYADFTEIHEGDKSNFAYGEGFGLGYGAYYKQYSEMTKTWVNVARTADQNCITLRDIVGVPNHPRVWRYDLYHLIGGYNAELPVADDYELLLRTFLRTKMARIPTTTYLQYRNSDGNNFTFIRNRMIRHLQFIISRHYCYAINKKIGELDLPQTSYYDGFMIWKFPLTSEYHRTKTILAGTSKKSLILILQKDLDKPPELEKDQNVVMISYDSYNLSAYVVSQQWCYLNHNRLRWWHLPNVKTSDEAINYALYVSGSNENEIKVIS
jgi:glycosyltransferase involved in cell wall biosynthesis